MITLIAAAAVAAAPTPPMQMPAHTPEMHQQHMAQMAGMKDCCCKEMMEKMHSGHDMDRMQDHQDQKGQ